MNRVTIKIIIVKKINSIYKRNNCRKWEEGMASNFESKISSSRHLQTQVLPPWKDDDSILKSPSGLSACTCS